MKEINNARNQERVVFGPNVTKQGYAANAPK